jgi:CTD kinase subunit beta
MREAEYPPRVRDYAGWEEYEADVEASLLGRNEGTVRFLFAPPGLGGDHELRSSRSYGMQMQY